MRTILRLMHSYSYLLTYRGVQAPHPTHKALLSGRCWPKAASDGIHRPACTQRDSEKGPLGPNSIPAQRWPGNQSTWCEIWPRAGSIWPHYLSVWLISESSLTRNGPFSGSRVILECVCCLSYFEVTPCMETTLIKGHFQEIHVHLHRN